MAARPKPLFWVVVLMVIGTLVWYAMNRAGGGGSSDTPAKHKSGDVMELQFYSSSAKKSWINNMVKAFNEEGVEAGGKVIQVKVTHVESGASLDALKDGSIKPDIWSPGDESWLQLGNSHWKNVYQRELYDKYDPLINVPLVIAMWEPMARALGYPNQIAWKDIAKVAQNPRGWAAYGHPEWGKFRLGHAHPDANSGFLAIISEVYAITGKTEGLKVSDLKDQRVIAFLRDIEGAVEHYGLSNSWIDELMRAKGPSYLSCAVQYENTIIESNEKSQNRPFKMVAVYPEEGNFWTQHPAAILKESWVTPDRAEASRKFLDFLLDKDAQTEAMKLGLRPIRQDVALAAPFDEPHGVQIDVSRMKRFTVPDEDILKRIRDLWEDVKMPATVVMVIDRSGSMQGAPMDGAREGAIEFVRHMKPRDKLRVIVFNASVSDLVPLCTIRECGEQAISQLSGVFAEGGTALYDATSRAYADLQRLMASEPRRRYSMLVLSDGKDTSSAMPRQDFLDALPRGEQYDVPKIFSIAYGDAADKDLLAEVSNRTNARLFKSSAEEIKKTYKELSANF